MENIFKDCDIKTDFLEKKTLNLSDNLYYYIWPKLLIDQSQLLCFDLKNALTNSIDEKYI
jgi:hypothetical protein